MEERHIKVRKGSMNGPIPLDIHVTKATET